jgi:hypothetical protein
MTIKKLREELEHQKWFNSTAAFDIKCYVACIHSTVDGESICNWCESYEECKLEAKDGKVCAEWWLKFPEKEEDHEEAAVPAADTDPAAGESGGSGVDPVPT